MSIFVRILRWKFEHILLFHEEEYKQLKPYIKNIIDNPDYIFEDNKHEDTMIYLKEIDCIGKNGRIVIKLVLGKDAEYNKNLIITLMKLNKRTMNILNLKVNSINIVLFFLGKQDGDKMSLTEIKNWIVFFSHFTFFTKWGCP